LLCVLWLNDTAYSKVSEEVNRKCPVRNTTVQLSTSYTDPERHMHSVTDRQTDKHTSGVFRMWERGQEVWGTDSVPEWGPGAKPR